jgi:hypothetical protein
MNPMDNAESLEAKEGGFQRTDFTSQEPHLPQETLKTPEIRKLIWRANLNFQVKDVDASTSSILTMSDLHGGTISDMQMTSNGYRIANKITLRVPNNKFQELIKSIKGESIYMDEATISSEDVTEEYVDIESRLASKREVRDRYIEILRTRTGTIDEVLAAEEAIRKITEEIEAKEGRLRFLKDRVSFSTITLSIYQKVDFKAAPMVYEKPYSEEMSESFGSGWGAIKSIFLGLILLWPILLPIIALAIWKRKAIGKFLSLKKTEKTS